MKQKCIFLFLFFLTAGIFAQVTFKTKVSKNKLGLNQRLRVEFSINQQGADNFSPPSFQNFEVIGGPSQSVNQSWVNGKSSYSLTYSYVIAPKRKGDLRILGATIEYKGKRIQSNPVNIAVVDAVELPKDPNDPDYIAQQNVHLKVLVSDSRPYVGEGIYVEYRLYFSNNVAISDFDFKEFPEYKGFWNQDIKIDQFQVQNGQYQGEDYRYFTLKKAVLIPQKVGKLELEPLVTNLIIGVPTGRGDFFGNPITRNIRKTFRTFSKKILVKPLPTVGRPDNFNGAVGDFKFRVKTSKNELKANESTQLTVSVSGKGNLKLFAMPKVDTPKELEVYTPEHKEKIKTALSGIKGLRGEVYDQYTLVPQFKGKYKIPSVSFSYFNPKEKKYHTRTSDEVLIRVTQGKELPVDSEKTAVVNKQNVLASKNDFRYLQNKTVFEAKKSPVFFKSPLFYVLLLWPILVLPLAILLGKKQRERAKDVAGNRTRKADKLARKYLSIAKRALGEKEAFYIALEKALHNYLKAKLRIETSEIQRDRISEILKKRGVLDTTIQSFLAVLNDCDFARYAPSKEGALQEAYDKAKEMIARLDKEL